VNDTQCTIEEIKKVITNVFYVDHVDYATDDAKVLGLVSISLRNWEYRISSI
jgi:hypothetical protein